MLRTDRLQDLAKLPAPVLTVYINTTANDASRHPQVQPCLTWLQEQAATTGQSLPSTDAKRFQQQVERIERFLQDRHPEEKALVIFAGSKSWKLLPLQVAVENQLHWGNPQLGQLVRLWNGHKSYGVVVIDHHAARFFAYSLGELTQLAEKQFDIDDSQWKKKDLGHFTGERIRKTRGSNRDVYEHRLEAQYERLCRETADEAVTHSKKFEFAGIFLVGPDRLIRTIQAKLPHLFSESVFLVAENLGKSSPSQLLRQLQPVLEDRERRQQITAVTQLLSADHAAVTDLDETLADLQNGRIHTAFVAHDLDLDLHQCVQCGLANRSADPVCATCGGTREKVPLRELLPKLLAAQDVKVEFMSGEAAHILMQAGGMGGWLRQAKATSAQ